MCVHYVCWCVGVCVSMLACVKVHACMLYECICERVGVCVYMNIHTYTYTCVYTCTYMICLPIRIYRYRYLHTKGHKYT